MTKRLAFVLSGGGARGALEIGAVRALLEGGYKPDILVGASIGAANAVVLALKGLDEGGLQALSDLYQKAADVELLSRDYMRLWLRALVNRPAQEPSRRIRDFYIANGITPGIRFGDLDGLRVLVVATDINHFTRVIYGLDPQDNVLDALVASTALPPWVIPIGDRGKLLVDGGLVSNLPLEPALSAAPRLMIALDVQERRDIPEDANGVGPLFNKLVNTLQRRQFELECALTAAKGVPMRYVHLYADQPTPIYAFDRWRELDERGYEQARAAMRHWPARRKLLWPF